MKYLAMILGALLFVAGVFAQAAAPTPAPAKPDRKPGDALNQAGGNTGKTTGPITTEIYADKTYFDSTKNYGIFTGHVKVIDPRFKLQADKLTVYLRRGEQQGLEKAVAEGNVGLVRERVEADGKTAQSVGRSERAVYTVADGNVELSGTPRVQQGMNMNIATSPDTVMVLNENGQLTTRGPSRTEIRQEPTSPTPAPPETKP